MLYLHFVVFAGLVAVAASAENDPICVDSQMELCPHKKFCCPTSSGAICGDDECIFKSSTPPPKDNCPIRGEMWCAEGTHCCADTVQCTQKSDGTPFCDMERTSAIVVPGSGDNSTMSILPTSAPTTSVSTPEPTSPNTTTTGGNPTTTTGGDSGSGAARSEALGSIAAILAWFAVFVGL